MSKAVSIAKEQVSAVIEAAMKKAMTAGMLPEAELPAFTVERPADRSHGDFATNAAMASARAFRMAPPKIAAAIMENLDLNGTYFVKAETAGPGFMNFFLGSAFYSDVLTEVLTKDSAYGRSDYGNHRKVMVEFVSANPTGPMHMGNARGGALGDCLASVLDAATTFGVSFTSMTPAISSTNSVSPSPFATSSSSRKIRRSSRRTATTAKTFLTSPKSTPKSTAMN